MRLYGQYNDPEGGKAEMSGEATIDIFLCHNSHDKTFVRDVAEGLELEFGMPYFLDVHAIPTGEAFLPWIDKALAHSRGCAIFLGANGWGETHFWEAERALDRYRRDPDFRLIPVVLPGIREHDMTRLGAGTLFSEINWADFRAGPADQDALDRLRAALLGKQPEIGRGPARLTPYLVRRDALRWQESKGKDRSILYRGKQLSTAEALRLTQPDLIAGPAIAAFLAASSNAQARRALVLSVVSLAAISAIGVFAVRAELLRTLSLSRYLAAEARQAPSVDTGLLLAVQATHVSDTPEAYGALLERLATQPYLRHMLRTGGSAILSLAFRGDEELYAGFADGSLQHFNLRTMARTHLLSLSSPVKAIAADMQRTDIWIGTLDGRVLCLDPSNKVVRQVTVSARGMPIMSLQLDPSGRYVAIGDHQHQIVLIDRVDGKLRWRQVVSAQRVTGLSFSADGALLAAGNSDGVVQVYAVASGQTVRTLTTARSGIPMALQFAPAGHLRVVDSGNTLTVFDAAAGSSQGQTFGEDFLSAAAVGPRREFGPVTRRDVVALGYANGDVGITPGDANDHGITRVRAHGRTVDAIALSGTARIAASGATDGTLAIWDLHLRLPVLTRQAPPVGEVLALAYSRQGRLLAMTSSPKTAVLVSASSKGWIVGIDLYALMMRVAGPASTDVHAALPDAEGFVEVEKNVVTKVAFDRDARHLAWSTRAGYVFWTSWPTMDSVKVLRSSGSSIVDIALDDSGSVVYVAENNGTIVRFDLATTIVGTMLHRLPLAARSLAAAKGRTSVFAALEDGTLRLLTFADGYVSESPQVRLPGIAGNLLRDAVSNRLITAGAGATAGVDVGEVEDFHYQRLPARRVSGASTAMALSREAGLIAVADGDGQLHLWDIENSAPLASIRISPSALTGLATSPDGRKLALSNIDGDIFELTLEKSIWLHSACAIVQRDIALEEWNPLFPGQRPSSVCSKDNISERQYSPDISISTAK